MLRHKATKKRMISSLSSSFNWIFCWRVNFQLSVIQPMIAHNTHSSMLNVIVTWVFSSKFFCTESCFVHFTILSGPNAVRFLLFVCMMMVMREKYWYSMMSLANAIGLQPLRSHMVWYCFVRFGFVESFYEDRTEEIIGLWMSFKSSYDLFNQPWAYWR